MNDSLFGKASEETPTSKPARAPAPAPSAELVTKSWDFLSYMYKTCRIGDAKSAVVCAEMLRQIIGEYKVVNTLNQLVGEDIHPLYYAKLQPVIHAYTETLSAKILKGHNLWQSVYLIAKAPKWYMDNAVQKFNEKDFYDGKELEDIRQYINIELKLHEADKMEEFAMSARLPTFTFDQHTRKGITLIKQGKGNLILDGGWENRYNVKKRWDDLFDAHPEMTYHELLAEYRKLCHSIV